MFVFSLKARYVKICAAVLILGVAAAAIVRLFPETPSSLPVNGAADAVADRLRDIQSGEDAAALLAELGYTVENSPCETVSVQVPRKFDAVYEAYNEIQLAQGFNLAKYGGKTLTRYTFQETAGENAMPSGRLISVLIRKKQVVGGDVYDPDGEGTVTGLIRT